MLKPKLTRIKKNIFFIAIIIVFFILSFYWLKNQMGINLSHELSLSKYFPFKFLALPQVIGVDQQGVVISENFDTHHLFNNWHGIYIEGEGKIIRSISSSGNDSSRYLLIINRGAKNWSISHNKFIEVNVGDHFTYGAKVKIFAGNPIANICADSFDKNMKIITWCYSKLTLEELDKWVNLVNSFSINDVRVKYIRLRINGIGQGQYRFDDIICKRKITIQ